MVDIASGYSLRRSQGHSALENEMEYEKPRVSLGVSCQWKLYRRGRINNHVLACSPRGRKQSKYPNTATPWRLSTCV